MATHLAKIDTYESDISNLKTDLDAAKLHQVSLEELKVQFSATNQEKEQFESNIKDLMSRLEASKNLEIKLLAEMNELQLKISELSTAEDRFQKNLNEATKNYK